MDRYTVRTTDDWLTVMENNRPMAVTTTRPGQRMRLLESVSEAEAEDMASVIESVRGDRPSVGPPPTRFKDYLYDN